MRKLLFLLVVLVFVGCNNVVVNQSDTLKDATKELFTFGAALNVDQIDGKDSLAINIVKKHFNSIVAENCMKSMYMQPEEGVFFFDDADAFVQFGVENDMEIIGHTLVWHSQAPDWLFVDDEGDEVTREVLIERMRNHITTIVSRYKGKIKGWDVVNEAVLDDGSLRESKFYKIIGPDFIKLAFQFAHEADPDVELYYNDYGVSGVEKCDGIYDVVKDLIDNDIRIDGVGMQGHINMGSPTVEEMEASIIKLSDLAGKVMITELDLTVLPWPTERITAEVSLSYQLDSIYNPYPNGMPDSVSVEFNDRYADFFRMFIKNRDRIERVTLWGVADHHSWRNDWPIEGRRDYPLLFDDQYQAKPVVEEIIKMANEVVLD